MLCRHDSMSRRTARTTQSAQQLHRSVHPLEISPSAGPFGNTTPSVASQPRSAIRGRSFDRFDEILVNMRSGFRCAGREMATRHKMAHLRTTT
jgi:hypothetical protein